MQKIIVKFETRKIFVVQFRSISKSRKLHGVDINGLSLETPEYGIVNYNEWINSTSRYLFLYFHSLLTHAVQSFEWISIWGLNVN